MAKASKVMMKGKVVLQETANMMKVTSIKPTVTLKLIKIAHRMISKAMSANTVMKKLAKCKKKMKIVKKASHHNRFEPTTIKEIIASPSIFSYFQDVGCLYFCKKIQEVTNYPLLTDLFSLRLDGEQVHIVGLDFVLTPKAVSKANITHS